MLAEQYQCCRSACGMADTITTNADVEPPTECCCPICRCRSAHLPWHFQDHIRMTATKTPRTSRRVRFVRNDLLIVSGRRLKLCPV